MFFAQHYSVVKFVPPVTGPPSCEMLCIKEVNTEKCWLLIYRPWQEISVKDKCLDLILTPRPELFLSVVMQPPALMKDHSLVECKWNFCRKPTETGVSRRNYTHVDYGMMSQILSATNWSAVFAESRTINQYWDSL